MGKFYYLYVLRSEKDGKIYIGKTKDLKERLRRHNRGDVKATKNRRPLKLIYYEAYLDKDKCSKQERFYKTGAGREVLKYRI